ncbi:hypothetical protein, conserved [Leishmania tarentolae]|uniref:Amastin-like surface protein-like protein n=1 Tax=Leishmania tarentolae TaxID=5689 RepID=A0A640KCV1_LEITA|nr:hypothetical protein, conserved [Leishmania tarentolae]
MHTHTYTYIYIYTNLYVYKNALLCPLSSSDNLPFDFVRRRTCFPHCKRSQLLPRTPHRPHQYVFTGIFIPVQPTQTPATMKCCRIFICILLLIFTACAVCSILFPVFKREADDGKTVDAVYLFYRQSSTPMQQAHGVTIARTYSYNLQCPQGQVYYTVAAALSVAGATFLGFAVLFTACWINARYKDGLSVTSTFMTFISLACLMGTLSLVVFTYLRTLCGGEVTQILAAEKDGYKLAGGFYLLCVTTAGALLCFLIGFALCCTTTCCGTELKGERYR